jgi:hypothetical protein
MMKRVAQNVSRRVRWFVFGILWVLGCVAYFASYLWWSGIKPPLPHVTPVVALVGAGAFTFAFFLSRIRVSIVGFACCSAAYPLVFYGITFLDANHSSGRAIAVWLVLIVSLVGFAIFWILDALVGEVADLRVER